MLIESNKYFLFRYGNVLDPFFSKIFIDVVPIRLVNERKLEKFGITFRDKGENALSLACNSRTAAALLSGRICLPNPMICDS